MFSPKPLQRFFGWEFRRLRTATRAPLSSCKGTCPLDLGFAKSLRPRVTTYAKQSHSARIACGGYPARNCPPGYRPRPSRQSRTTFPACDNLRRAITFSRNRPPGYRPRPSRQSRTTFPACDNLRRAITFSRNRLRGLPRPASMADRIC